MLEGLDLVRTALDEGAPVEGVYLAAEGAWRPEVAEVVEVAEARGVRVHRLAPGVLAKVAATVTPQPALAVVVLPRSDLSVLSDARLVVACVGLGDPGNAGTVVRTADACGLDAVVLAGHGVDPFNPKAVRASAGSLLHLPVVVVPDEREALDALAAAGLRRLAALTRGGEDYATVDWTVPTAVVLGNEAHGLDPGVVGSLEGTVSVPMGGRAESLNVATACAVVCFEARRQARLAKAGQAATYDAEMTGEPS